MILGCLWAMKRRSQNAATDGPIDQRRRRRVLVIALGVVIVASLLASAVLTRTSPEAAYFFALHPRLGARPGRDRGDRVP